MAGKLKAFPPFWAVGPECRCLMTPVRYTEGKSVQYGLQVGSLEQPPFYFMSPVLIEVLHELTIGTDATEAAAETAIREVGMHFPGSKAEGIFSSGPIVALFPHSDVHQAMECAQMFGRRPKKHPKKKLIELPAVRADNPLVYVRDGMRLTWETATRDVLWALTREYGLPHMHFVNYSDAVRCGVRLE